MAFVMNNALMIFVTDYWVYVIIYGVMNGIAIGFGYLPALYTAWTYFPDKKSLATGVILFCAGMSASIASPIVTMIVNPNKVKSSDEEVVKRVPLLFTYLTIGYGVIALVSCTLQPPPFKSEKSKERAELRRKLTLVAAGPEKDQLQTRIRGMSVVTAFNNRITDRELAAAGKEYIVRRTMYSKVGEEDALMLGQMKLDQIEEMMSNTGIINLEKNPEQDTSGFGRGTADHLVENLLSTNEEKPPEDFKQELYRLSQEIQESSCPSFRAGICSQTFLFLGMMSYCCAIYNYFLLNSWKELFKSSSFLGMPDDKLAFLLSVGAVANSTFRIFAGLLLLKFQFKTLYYILITCIISGAFSFYKVTKWTGSEFVGSAYLFLGFAGLGTAVTIFPTACTKAFGTDVGSKIYPCIYLCFSIASLSSYMLIKYFKNFEDLFFYLGCIAVCGLTVSLFFNPEPNWSNAQVDHAYKEKAELDRAKEAKYGRASIADQPER